MKKNESYLPIILGAITGVLTLNLWYLSALAIEKDVAPSEYGFIVTLVAAISGAFFGSFSAFKLKQYEEDKVNENVTKKAFDVCFFTLARQQVALLAILSDYDKHPSQLERAFSLEPIQYPNYEKIQVNTHDFFFLSGLSDVNKLLELAFLQDRFEQMIWHTERRNEFIKSHLEPAFMNNNLLNRAVSPAELEAKLGDLFPAAVTLYESTYKETILTLKQIVKIQNDMLEIAKVKHPKKGFLILYDTTKSDDPSIYL